MLWSFLRLSRSPDNIKLGCRRVIKSTCIESVQDLGSMQSRGESSFMWWIYRGMIQANLHPLILVHGLVMFPAKAFLGSCKETKICWPGFWLDFIPLCGGSLYISLIARAACIIGSCLNCKMDFNELQFLLLSWNWSSHRLN